MYLCVDNTRHCFSLTTRQEFQLFWTDICFYFWLKETSLVVLLSYDWIVYSHNNWAWEFILPVKRAFVNLFWNLLQPFNAQYILCTARIVLETVLDSKSGFQQNTIHSRCVLLLTTIHSPMLYITKGWF